MDAGCGLVAILLQDMEHFQMAEDYSRLTDLPTSGNEDPFRTVYT
jgi:hypothetical protein